jgi:DNA-binding beta-propeller fold protein YncE
MKAVSRRYRWSFPFLFVLALLCARSPLGAHADGGAPNLAYVSGTPSGISVIDVLQRRVTKRFSIAGDPHTILLSLDGRFLYVTQPGLGQVSVLLAATGRPVCSSHLPGKPAFLALDPYSNILYAAGRGASRVTALDPTTCVARYVFETESNVFGLAVALSPTGSSVNHQLWVAGMGALAIYDGLTEQRRATIPVPDGPQYLSFPPGETGFVTTRQGTVDAVDIGTRAVRQLLAGGTYGPMDYDELTGEVYVPDERHNLLAVLAPVFAGSPVPKEPGRVIRMDTAPETVAITNDGSFGFIALRGGKAVMLDLLGRQIASTIDVGGTPHFVITGLFPPSTQITPAKASTTRTAAQAMPTGTIPVIAASVLALVFLVLLVLSLRRRYAGSADRAGALPGKE